MEGELTFEQLDIIYARVSDMRLKAKIKEGLANFKLKYNHDFSTILSKIRFAKTMIESDGYNYVIHIELSDGHVYAITVCRMRVDYVYSTHSTYRIVTRPIKRNGTSIFWHPADTVKPVWMTEKEYECIRWLQGNTDWFKFRELVDMCRANL